MTDPKAYTKPDGQSKIHPALPQPADLLDLGLKIKKIRRALRFKQSPWLKQYTDFNTQNRALDKERIRKGCTY